MHNTFMHMNYFPPLHPCVIYFTLHILKLLHNSPLQCPHDPARALMTSRRRRGRWGICKHRPGQVYNLADIPCNSFKQTFKSRFINSNQKVCISYSSPLYTTHPRPLVCARTRRSGRGGMVYKEAHNSLWSFYSVRYRYAWLPSIYYSCSVVLCYLYYRLSRRAVGYIRSRHSRHTV